MTLCDVGKRRDVTTYLNAVVYVQTAYDELWWDTKEESGAGLAAQLAFRGKVGQFPDFGPTLINLSTEKLRYYQILERPRNPTRGPRRNQSIYPITSISVALCKLLLTTYT